MNGSYLTKSCYSRYEVANLWDISNEWLSSQFYAPSTSGGYFIASALDPGDNLLEGFLTNGTVGPTLGGYSSTSINPGPFGSTSATTTVLPLFGVRAVSVDATLGSKSVTMNTLDYGSAPSSTYTSISSGSNTNGVMLGLIGQSWAVTSRYAISLSNPNYASTAWSAPTAVTSRCAGQVGP